MLSGANTKWRYQVRTHRTEGEEVQRRFKAKDGTGAKGTMGPDQGRVLIDCSLGIGEAQAPEGSGAAREAVGDLGNGCAARTSTCRRI